MQSDGVSAKRKWLALNRKKLQELRLAVGIESDAELARRIGVDPTTLYRLTTGRTKPSNEFLAGLKDAFPLASLDDLTEMREAS